jgi:hypothetical protein
MTLTVPEIKIEAFLKLGKIQGGKEFHKAAVFPQENITSEGRVRSQIGHMLDNVSVAVEDFFLRVF